MEKLESTNVISDEQIISAKSVFVSGKNNVNSMWLKDLKTYDQGTFIGFTKKGMEDEVDGVYHPADSPVQFTKDMVVTITKF